MTHVLVTYEVSKPTNFKGHQMNKIYDFKLFDGENGNGEMDISIFLMRHYFTERV